MVNIYIEGQLIDQFNDESVEVVSQVLDIEDITKVKGDYSKTFTVPASKVNNRIFKHWYNASIEGGFDARTKVKGNIDIDGIPFKTGKFLLRKAKIEGGIITSYTINFFGNVTSFKDIIGDDKLTDLNFGSYDFIYNSSTVKDRLTPSSLDMYPELIFTVSGKTNYYYNTLFSVKDNSDNVVTGNAARIPQGPLYSNNMNIAYANVSRSNDSAGLLWNTLLPSLRMDQVIQVIEGEYTKFNGYSNDIIFSRDFFGTTEFSRLYLMLTGIPEEGESSETTNEHIVNWQVDGSSQNYINVLSDTFSDNTFSSGDSWNFRFEARQNNDINGSVAIRVYDGDGELRFSNSGFAELYTDNGGNEYIDYEYEWNVTHAQYPDLSNWSIYVIADDASDLDFTLRHTKNGGSMKVATGIQSGGAVQGSSTYQVGKSLPDIKVIDLMKALFQMFKLVIIPQEDGTLYVNSHSSYYEQGTHYDVSKYVDRSSLEVSRGNIISNLELKFQETESYKASEHRQAFSRGYGDASITLVDENNDKLEGDSLTIELPFDGVKYDRLYDDRGDTSAGNTNIQALSLTKKLGIVDNIEKHEAVDIGAILHYAVANDITSKPIHYRGQTGGSQNGFSKLEGLVYFASHHIDIENPFSALMFEREISTYTGEVVNNTLYFNHYEDYINDVFSIKRRMYSYTAKLPTIMSANLQLNDVLTIDGIRHRINKFSYNLLTGMTKLDIFNSSQTTLTQSGSRTPSTITMSALGDSYTFALDLADLYTITKTSLGSGTTWLQVSTSFQTSRGVQRHNRVTITVDQYTTSTSAPRQMKINLTSPSGVQSFITIVQYGT